MHLPRFTSIALATGLLMILSLGIHRIFAHQVFVDPESLLWQLLSLKGKTRWKE